jgi:hypothetical protein
LTNKVPWWVASDNLSDFDHSQPTFNLICRRLIFGSWCNYDKMQHYFEKFIDRDIRSHVIHNLKQILKKAPLLGILLKIEQFSKNMKEDKMEKNQRHQIFS